MLARIVCHHWHMIEDEVCIVYDFMQSGGLMLCKDIGLVTLCLL